MGTTRQRSLLLACGLVLALGVDPAAAIEVEELPELFRLDDGELVALKVRYEKKRSRHQKKIPPIKQQLRKGTRLLAQEMYPLQASLQAEIAAVEKYTNWIDEIDAEFGRRKQVEVAVAEKKQAARQELATKREEEIQARREAQERRVIEEESYRNKLALLDAELDRREREETEEREGAEVSRKRLYGGIAVALLVLAIAGVVAIFFLRRR